MPDKKRADGLDWEDIRYFVALARHGTLSATARALGVNHATVARRVASLERLLGRALFDRRAGGYPLTAHGKAVLDEATTMDEAALAVLRRLDAGTELNGLVRLTTPRVLADGFLIARLDGLHRRYPALDLELIAEARLVSVARREADIALRFGAPEDSDLVSRRVGRIGFGLYAAPACRDRLKAGGALGVIGFEDDNDSIFEAAWLARTFRGHRFAFRSNSQVAQAAAARAGFGVALLPRYLVDEGLVPVLPDERLPVRDVWLLTRRDLAKVPRIRVVNDYLAALFKKERRRLGGG